MNLIILALPEPRTVYCTKWTATKESLYAVYLHSEKTNDIWKRMNQVSSEIIYRLIQ